jgi:protein tyrosine phosphatase (PTP) superfamily phosphohydrolase (DUF442 family)
MKYVRSVLAVLGLLAWITGGLYAQQAAPAVQGQQGARAAIPNYVELTPLIGTGGQPVEDGIKDIAGKGYKAVVNIRASDEEYDRIGEEKLAVQLGLQYIIIPFATKDASESQALAFHALMTALKNTKTFVHCGSGNRVGSLMMVHLALGGMTADQAEQEAKKVGLRSADLLEFAKKVIAKQKK